MSDIYNITTSVAELLALGTILWQMWLINKLERDIWKLRRYIWEMENAEDINDTDCPFGDD
jgi:hypothetical protein